MRLTDLLPRFLSRPREHVQARQAPVPAGGHGARAAATFAASLTFENVARSFGDAVALAGVSLAVRPGEIVCLLGPSGCGKTTLLRIASGIERPSAGRVLINEREVAGPTRFVPPEKRNVGLMFQDFALFPHLSIVDNVVFGLRYLPAAAARREGLAVLARVGLEAYADEFPDILSGGQQQRVALARALVPRPAVVLMDEPFSGLDVQLRDAMQEEVRALLKETRATAMIVTHHPEEAMRLGDRIAVMRRGGVVQAGTAEELYRAPADVFVGRLFSEINEIVLPVADGIVRTPFGDVPAPNVGDGRRAILCVRRRALRIVASGEGLSGRVLATKFQGDLAELEIGIQGLDKPLRMLVREARQPPVGAEVTIAVDRDGLLVFPDDDPT
ncbi:MAG: ABC transporter ATP-binding protein [Hyphomicrobiaceae bacterium]